LLAAASSGPVYLPLAITSSGENRGLPYASTTSIAERDLKRCERPDDLHRAARSLARDRGQSLSHTISELVRRALSPNPGDDRLSVDPDTNLPLVRLGVPVTTEMARSAADDE
jgi:hypothetical protein